MTDISEQIKAIEEEIRRTPYHKATEHHIGMLRAKIARLKDKQQEMAAKKSGGGGGYAVKKQGDATVVLVGPPSVGKSTLLNKLTNAKSKIAPYAFTTVRVVPGMMKYKDAYIQVLDVPGLIEGAETGKGRGREVLSVIRASDLLIIISEVEEVHFLEKIVETLENNGIRINKTPPDVKIVEKVSGGITVQSNIKQDLKKEEIKQLALEYGIRNAEIIIRQKITTESLIDAFSSNKVYVPAVFVLNKIDLIKKEEKQHFPFKDVILISAEKEINLDILREKIWEKLGLIRVYLVRKGEKPSFNNLIIMKKGQTLKDLAKKIGSDFALEKSRARIWNTGAKFPGQEVSLSTKLLEGMQVTLL